MATEIDKNLGITHVTVFASGAKVCKKLSNYLLIRFVKQAYIKSNNTYLHNIKIFFSDCFHGYKQYRCGFNRYFFLVFL